jgi:hypothetical protein
MVVCRQKPGAGYVYRIPRGIVIEKWSNIGARGVLFVGVDEAKL